MKSNKNTFTIFSLKNLNTLNFYRIKSWEQKLIYIFARKNVQWMIQTSAFLRDEKKLTLTVKFSLKEVSSRTQGRYDYCNIVPSAEPSL